MAVALKKTEIDAAIAAAAIPKAQAAGIWPAAKAARDGAPAGTPEASRRALAVAAAIAVVAAQAPTHVAAFTAALTASAPTPPTPVTPSVAAPTPPVPAPTPALTPVPAKYDDAVDRGMKAAGIPAADQPAAASDFADAIATGHTIDEALTRLFEGRGLTDEAIAKGRARFAGLASPKVPWWKRVLANLKAMVSTKGGAAQLVLLVVGVMIFFWAPVPAKTFVLIFLLGLILFNLWSNRREALIALNIMFIAFVLFLAVGLPNVGGGDTYNINYGNGVGDSTEVIPVPTERP